MGKVTVWTASRRKSIQRRMENGTELDMVAMAQRIGVSLDAVKLKVRTMCKEKFYKPIWIGDSKVRFEKDVTKEYSEGKQAIKYICESVTDDDIIPIHIYAVDNEHARMVMKEDFPHIKLGLVLPATEYRKQRIHSGYVSGRERYL